MTNAAWHEGTKVAAELIGDLGGKFEPGEHWRLEVTDAAKKILNAIHFNSEETK
jgi:hypothetical protein